MVDVYGAWQSTWQLSQVRNAALDKVVNIPTLKARKSFETEDSDVVIPGLAVNLIGDESNIDEDGDEETIDTDGDEQSTDADVEG